MLLLKAARCRCPGPDPVPGPPDVGASRDLANDDLRTAGDLFVQSHPDGSFGASVVICPLLDDRGHRQGAFSQSVESASSQRSLDSELLGQNSDLESPGGKQINQNNEFLDKSEKDQDDILSKALPPDPHDRHSRIADAVSRHGHIDLKQSQLFQRFSELLPTGLAILNHNVSARSLRPHAPQDSVVSCLTGWGY